VACERHTAVLGRRRRWLAEVSPAFARFRARGHVLGRGQVLRGAGGTANLSRWSGRWLRRPWRRAPQGGGAAKGGVQDAGATTRFAQVKRVVGACGSGERVWQARVSEKGSRRGSRVCFYRARRGDGLSDGHQWPWRAGRS
jgi:hypothetical protein